MLLPLQYFSKLFHPTDVFYGCVPCSYACQRKSSRRLSGSDRVEGRKQLELAMDSSRNAIDVDPRRNLVLCAADLEHLLDGGRKEKRS